MLGNDKEESCGILRLVPLSHFLKRCGDAVRRANSGRSRASPATLVTGRASNLFLTCKHRENSASKTLCMALQSPS